MKTSYPAKLLTLYLGILIALMPTRATAEDIDIFTGSSAGKNANPNVLIVIDNTSNWSRASQKWPGGITQGQSEADAIKTVLNALGTKGANVNIGLMEFATNGTANDNGGFIRYAIRTMDPATTNVSDFSAKMKTIYDNISSPNEKRSANTPYGNLMYDVYNYYAGQGVSNDGSNACASLNPPGGSSSNNLTDSGGYTTDYSQFLSPISTVNSCAHNFVIFIGNPNTNGPAADSNDNSCALYKLTNGTTTCPAGKFSPQLGLPNFSSVGSHIYTPLGQTAKCYTPDQANNSLTGFNALLKDCVATGTDNNCYLSLVDSNYITATSTTNSTKSACDHLIYSDSCNLGSATTTNYPMACASGTQSYNVIQTGVTVTGPTAGTTSQNSANSSVCYQTLSAASTAISAASSPDIGTFATSTPSGCPVPATPTGATSTLTSHDTFTGTNVYYTTSGSTTTTTTATNTCTYSTGAAYAQCTSTNTPTTTATTSTTNAGPLSGCYTSTSSASSHNDVGTFTCPSGYTCGYTYSSPTSCSSTSSTNTGTTSSCYVSSSAASTAITGGTDIGGMTCPTTPLDAFGNPPVCSYSVGAASTSCTANTTSSVTTDYYKSAPTITTSGTPTSVTSPATSTTLTCPTGSSCTYSIAQDAAAPSTSTLCTSSTTTYCASGVTSAYYSSAPTFATVDNNTSSAISSGISGTGLSCPAYNTCVYSAVQNAAETAGGTTTGISTNLYYPSAPTFSSITNATGSSGVSLNNTQACGGSGQPLCSLTNPNPITATGATCPSYNNCSYGTVASSGSATGNGGTFATTIYTSSCLANSPSSTTFYNYGTSSVTTNYVDTNNGSGNDGVASYFTCPAGNTCVISPTGTTTSAGGCGTKKVYEMKQVATGGMKLYTFTQTATAQQYNYTVTQTATPYNKYKVTQSETKNKYIITQTSVPQATYKYTVTQTQQLNANNYTVTQTVNPSTKVTSTSTTDLGPSSQCYSSAPTYAWSNTSDYTDNCTGTISGASVSCAYGTSTASTTNYCSKGTYQYIVQGNDLTLVQGPNGTFTTDTAVYNADEWAKLLFQKGVPVYGAAMWVSGTTYAFGDFVESPKDLKTYVRITNAAGTWVSGTTYAIGDQVQSTQDLKTYTRLTSGAGTADPSLDSANWSSATVDPSLDPVNWTPGNSYAPVATYTIDVYNAQPNNTETGLYMSMAKNGGGKYYAATNESAITAALNNILAEIQSVNSTFASASLPVNSTNRAQNANQVFIGMFRPDPTAGPRWFGNLKQYQIGSSNGTLDLFDTSINPATKLPTGKPAINSQTGFLDDCAQSFWTTDSPTLNSTTYPWANNVYNTDSYYWNNIIQLSTSPASKCTFASNYSASLYSDIADGAFVEKGAAAEVLRKGNEPAAATPTWSFNRNMYTLDISGTTPVLASYTSSNSGLSTDAFHFTQGKDVDGDCSATPAPCAHTSYSDPAYWSVNTNIMRPSVHGDVVHSRPLPINYGTLANANAGVTAYYGANDGTFHAVITTGAEAGKELWAFTAPEFSSALASRSPTRSTDPLTRLMNNSPLVNYPNVSTSLKPTPLVKDYFFDGSTGVYQNIDNTKVWIYPSMRRGGRMIYSFDVTNSNPSLSAGQPVKFKWRAGCPDLTDDIKCTADSTGNSMSDIGQTWSTPAPAIIEGYSTTQPVVVVGGGYDDCEDADTSSPSCGSGKGHIVYVLDADTGDIIKSFDLNAVTDANNVPITAGSVIADVAFTDSDNDSFVDFGYALDTRGNVYRLNFSNPATGAHWDSSLWTIQRIAYTSGGGRKFEWAPAVLPATINNKTQVFLAFASGDREHPLLSNYPYTTQVINRLYVYMDDMATTNFNLDGATMSNFSAATTCNTPGVGSTSNTNKGWYMNFPYSVPPYGGEQAVTSAVIAGGMVTVSTNRPIPPTLGACSTALGEARGYWVNLFNASGAMDVTGNCGGNRSGTFAGGGLPPSPVIGTVPIDGVPTTVLIGAIQREGGASSPIAPQKLRPTIPSIRKPHYWKNSGDN